MGAEPIRSEAIVRGARMLRTAMGTSIARWLAEPAVIEVMLNPDGRLWVDRLGGGIADSGERLTPADGERIIRLVAHHVGAEVHARAPRVSCQGLSASPAVLKVSSLSRLVRATMRLSPHLLAAQQSKVYPSTFLGAMPS